MFAAVSALLLTLPVVVLVFFFGVFLIALSITTCFAIIKMAKCLDRIAKVAERGTDSPPLVARSDVSTPDWLK